jgi:hypothetical protein
MAAIALVVTGENGGPNVEEVIKDRTVVRLDGVHDG